jgi:hypothetical protein
MMKRRKVGQPATVPRVSQFAPALLSKDIAELLGSFCTNRWLSALALTCKAAFRITYVLTAKRHQIWDFEKLLHDLQHNPTWSQHTARLAYVRRLSVYRPLGVKHGVKHAVAPVFPAELTGVEMLNMTIPCTPRSQFPGGVKTMFTHKITFNPKNQQPTTWPSTLETLHVAMAVTLYAGGDPLPPTLKKLVLQKYSGTMPAGVLPASLVKLKIQVYGVGPTGSGVFPEGVLPAGLTHFTIGGNCILAEGVLPPGLVKATFKQHFDQQLTAGMLNPALEHLKFMTYNKELQIGVLPEGLKYLNVGHVYNHPLQPYVLPASLECLILGRGYRQSFIDMSVESHVLPPGLRTLDVSHASGEIQTFFRFFNNLDRIRPLLEIVFDVPPHDDGHYDQ